MQNQKKYFCWYCSSLAVEQTPLLLLPILEKMQFLDIFFVHSFVLDIESSSFVLALKKKITKFLINIFLVFNFNEKKLTSKKLEVSFFLKYQMFLVQNGELELLFKF